MRSCADVNPCWSHHLNKDPPAAGLLPLRCGFHSDEGESAQFLYFYCSAFIAFLFCLRWRSDFSQCQSKYTWFVARLLSDVSMCELSCLCMSLYEMSPYCLCWQIQQLTFCSSLNPRSLNNLSCGVQLWQDWWTLLNYKPSYHLIGMLFQFKYAAWLVTAVIVNTHNIMLQYVSSGSYSDKLRDYDVDMIDYYCFNALCYFYCHNDKSLSVASSFCIPSHPRHS